MQPLEQLLLDFSEVGRQTVALPEKPTCTAKEASVCLTISERQIRNWVEDGTLLAINSAREPIAVGVERKRTERDRWRVVVRRPPNIPPKSGNTFLTLEELVGRISNINAG